MSCLDLWSAPGPSWRDWPATTGPSLRYWSATTGPSLSGWSATTRPSLSYWSAYNLSLIEWLVRLPPQNIQSTILCRVIDAHCPFYLWSLSNSNLSVFFCYQLFTKSLKNCWWFCSSSIYIWSVRMMVTRYVLIILKVIFEGCTQFSLGGNFLKNCFIIFFILASLVIPRRLPMNLFPKEGFD